MLTCVILRGNTYKTKEKGPANTGLNSFISHTYQGVTLNPELSFPHPGFRSIQRVCLLYLSIHQHRPDFRL